MYQGDNQTALKSQNVIGETFLELMSEKQYSAISVREICTRAGVSRQTFYSLFETKENVVLYLMQRTCSHPDRECLEEETLCLDQMCDSFADFIYGNFDFLRLLMEHDLHCVIYQSIYRILADCSSCAERRDLKRDYVNRFITGGITGFISGTVTEDTNKDPEYLRAALRRLFHGDFFD